jgi:hypothetical protein
VRAALHAGTAVILERGEASELELGNLLRTVQSLRDLSPESAVVVSDAAGEVLQDCVELGERVSVALAGSVQVYRPLLRLGLPRRARHVLPLIGRQEERSLLARACQRCAQGSGKLLLCKVSRASANRDCCKPCVKKRPVRCAGPRCEPPPTPAALRLPQSRIC